MFADCMTISANGYVSFLRYDVNKTPHTSGTFLRILLVCLKTVFFNSVICLSMPLVFNLFSRGLARFRGASVTDGTTVTFKFYTFQGFLHLLNFLFIYSFIILYSQINYLAFMVFSISDKYFRTSCSHKKVCLIIKSVSHYLFLMTTSGSCSYHIGLFVSEIFQRILFSIQICLPFNSFWEVLEYLRTMWLIVSSALLHILHFVHSCDFSIFL